MIPFSLQFAVDSVNGTFFGDPALLSKEVRNVTIDSRNAGPGVLYVPVIGLVHDGHSFISSAFENGALCTLSDHKLNTSLPYILVKDTTLALQQLSEQYLLRNRVKVIGITGSVGKTSTKEMLNAVLSVKFNTYHTPGNLNNQTGVPQAVFQIEKEHELAILELGTNHPGEIRALSKIVKPDICVITNIGVAHIEFFGSREGIFKGKTEILDYMQPDGIIVVNGDDAFLRTVPDAVLYGMDSNNTVRAAHIIEHGFSGTDFLLEYKGESHPMSVPTPGMHSVYNALAAISCGLRLGMSFEQLQEGLSGYRPEKGRMFINRTSRFLLVDDSYNANPDSVKAAIDVLKKESGRKVVILGDMFELGDEAPVYHREVGKYAADNKIDMIFCIGKLSKNTFDAASSVQKNGAFHFDTQDELHRFLPSVLRDGDVILVKGSRGMHLENTVSFLESLND